VVDFDWRMAINICILATVIIVGCRVWGRHD